MTTHSDDHDFDQFRGKLDHPVAPSQAFTTSLKARVTHAPEREVPESVQSPLTFPVDTVSIPTGAEPIVEESWRAPRWMRAFEAAVASLLILSMITASVALRQPTALWDLAFQPAPQKQSLEINFGGDPGRTWNLGDVEPETGGYRIDPNIPVGDMQFGQVGYSRLLVDDSFLFSAGPDQSAGNLVRYDLARSETVWTSSAIAEGPLASDGERIFTFQTRSETPTESVTLIAIDFETGDVVWEGPELVSMPDSFSSLVLSNSTVFATDYLGNVLALNSDDGSLIWQYPDAFATPPPATEVPIGGEVSALTPEIVANDESVFVGLPGKSVLKLDRETGANQGSIDLLGDYGKDVVFSTIQVREDRLVVAAVHDEQKRDQNDIFGDFPANILIFNAGSLELQTRTDLQNYGGNIVLTDDAAFVPTSMEPDGMAHVYRLDFATGELGEPLLGIQSPRGMLLSASGSVLMVTGYPSYIGFFDLDSGDLINAFELETPILETPFNQQVQMWKSNPIVITALGGIYVVMDDPPGP